MSRRLSISCAEENIVNGVYNERGLHEGVPLFVKVDGSCLMRIRWESPYHDHDRWQWDLVGTEAPYQRYYIVHQGQARQPDGVKFHEDKMEPPSVGWRTEKAKEWPFESKPSALQLCWI